MSSARNESNSSINKNAISTPLSPPSAINISKPIENIISQSNGVSSAPNAANDFAPSDYWKCRKCSKINDDRMKRNMNPCFSYKPGLKRIISRAEPKTTRVTSISSSAGDQRADAIPRGIGDPSNEVAALQNDASVHEAMSLSFPSDATRFSN